MGDTRRYAERMNLIEMEPRGDLSSSGYALVNPGREYLVLQPRETADPVAVDLAAGTYAVEWFGVERRETVPAGTQTIECATTQQFAVPSALAGPVVLSLQRVGGVGS
jgi:hypothetical protein